MTRIIAVMSAIPRLSYHLRSRLPHLCVTDVSSGIGVTRTPATDASLAQRAARNCPITRESRRPPHVDHVSRFPLLLRGIFPVRNPPSHSLVSCLARDTTEQARAIQRFAPFVPFSRELHRDAPFALETLGPVFRNSRLFKKARSSQAVYSQSGSL